MSLAAWKRIDVALPVTVSVVDGETFTGCLYSSNSRSFVVTGEDGRRWYHWPARADRIHTDTADATVKAGDQLTWIDARFRTVTLTIRKEEPCAR